MKYKFMIGVLPGYGHENENLNEETALEWGSEAYKEATHSEEEASIGVAAAIYSKDWGCPAGGELGIEVLGTASTKEEVENIVKEMMEKLGQSTCTIEFEDENENSLGSSYVKDKGENIDRNEPQNAERFSVKIPMNKVNMHDMGERLQEAVVQVGSREGMYYATGILSKGVDEKTGVEYLEYAGSQNPMFSPDTKAFVESAYCAIRKATKDLGPLCIEFNEKSVLTESIKQREKNKDEKDFDR